ncbi:MAG: MFS transporter [Planctomycetota bacterium]|nr:MFS transporter [Planctomycetota bacterium]
MAINPFQGLPRPRAVFSWGMYDLANQSFQLLINTLLFPLYVRNVIALDTASGDSAWSTMTTGGLVGVMVLAPLIGALADARAWKRELLLGTGFASIALMLVLPFLGPGSLALAIPLYITTAILVGLGETFLGSFLPQLSTPQTVGRVSAIGWTMSYIGALGLLGIAALAVFQFGLDQPSEWRWLFVLAAIWFLLGMLPSIFHLREETTPTARANPLQAVGQTFQRLGATIRSHRRHRQLFRFLVAFGVYSMGTLTVIFYAGIIGEERGFDIGMLIVMALVMTLTAGVGAVLAAKYQDRLGHRRTITLFLLAWIASTVALGLLAITNASTLIFFAISAGIGLGLGGIGTASRAMVGAFTPDAKAAEFFGLWGMVYRLGGALGVMTFGILKRPTILGDAYALFVITLFFLVGLGLLMRVNEKAGMLEAGQPERA